eukprot:gene34023-41958_t
MSKSLRLSEKWFRRGLWLVAVVFASFLIGLGGTVVGDLPKVERPLQVDDFLDKAAADKLRAEVKTARQAEQDAQTALDARSARPILAAIAAHASQGRDIYLHCAMGYQRSRIIAQLYTEYAKQCASRSTS